MDHFLIRCVRRMYFLNYEREEHYPASFPQRSPLTELKYLFIKILELIVPNAWRNDVS